MNFKIGGQIVSSQEISSNGSYDYTHSFTSTGSKKVTAEVIDNALYDNSNSTTVSVAAIGSSLSITSPASGETVSAGNTEVTWDTVSGASHKLCWSENGGGFTCVSDSGENGKENITTSAGNDYSIYVEAEIGGNVVGTSATIAFSAS